jgi:hypothetical protein
MSKTTKSPRAAIHFWLLKFVQKLETLSQVSSGVMAGILMAFLLGTRFALAYAKKVVNENQGRQKPYRLTYDIMCRIKTSVKVCSHDSRSLANIG